LGQFGTMGASAGGRKEEGKSFGSQKKKREGEWGNHYELGIRLAFLRFRAKRSVPEEGGKKGNEGKEEEEKREGQRVEIGLSLLYLSSL